MRVRMTVARVFQDAGQERMLDVGREYELPGLVAASLIATGVAEHVAPAMALDEETKPELPLDVAPMESVVQTSTPPLERPGVAPFETGRQRRRA